MIHICPHRFVAPVHAELPKFLGEIKNSYDCKATPVVQFLSGGYGNHIQYAITLKENPDSKRKFIQVGDKEYYITNLLNEKVKSVVGVVLSAGATFTATGIIQLPI